MDKTQIIILAGGKGTRMQTDGPKVLVEAGGVPIILRLLKAVEAVCPKPTIIVGYRGEKVIEATGNKYHYIWQKEQLGTGHAVACARAELENKDFERIIVLPGDHPLLSEATLLKLAEAHEESGAILTLTTGRVESFDGDFAAFYNFGRIVRNGDGSVLRIVELKDANEREKKNIEVNLGYYCFQADWLWQNIDKLQDFNKAKEYYLTDLVRLAVDRGEKVSVFTVEDIAEGFGINTPEQLAIAEKYLNR
jgi:bifunctional UDP-N-acetylglucosamine pyrophosphorylase/glucosamine-1-phosphate N-acetyltransferase